MVKTCFGQKATHISQPLHHFSLIDNRNFVNKAVLMFQLEIGKRLTAQPNNKTYGGMTVLVQYHARATGLFTVSKRSFSPKPKVDSMVLELDFGSPHPRRAVDEDCFRKVVKITKKKFLHM